MWAYLDQIVFGQVDLHHAEVMRTETLSVFGSSAVFLQTSDTDRSKRAGAS